ncbi:Myosin-7B [Larimichthys crocea]|uniref:Uncharacterized protein n=1 Tax=Larimichthys crocea TaxID=215358 RepID=A0ACD3RIT4_LARCR|nr:Myosin-7B [Larimichthys crocea]
MSRYDTKEFGEAAPFLRKSDLELLSAQTVAFDGKKRAWIPDEKEAYIEIEIKELSGDKVIVETKDGRLYSSRALNDTTLIGFSPYSFAAWSCHQNRVSDPKPGFKEKRKKAASFQTVSQLHKATSEKMCRLYEDQMNEAKAKADELQRQLNEANTQRARAQAESEGSRSEKSDHKSYRSQGSVIVYIVAQEEHSQHSRFHTNNLIYFNGEKRDLDQ